MNFKSIFISLLLYPLLGTNAFAQTSIQLVNYHISDHNKRDLNQEYINTQTAKIKNLDSNSLVAGFIIRSGDTVHCKIYLPKRKINYDEYLYIIANISGDSYYIFTPKDISGYSADGISMTAHRSIVSGDTSYFFIKLIEKGTIALYDRIEIPSDNEYLYYFKRSEDKDLMFLAPNKQSDFYMEEHGMYGTRTASKYNGPDEKTFRTAFAEYLKDCESVRAKISSKFYTVNDIETIIKEYNRCKR